MGSSSSTERHSFSVQDNGLICYNRRQELKSRNCELIVLLFLLEIYRKYERTGKSIIKEIAMYVRK